jgi:hypothetical protein
MAFKTHLLPDSHDILDHVSIDKNRSGSGTIRGNTHSTNADAGKNVLWPGATRFWREYHAKIPSGFGGRSRPRIFFPSRFKGRAGPQRQALQLLTAAFPEPRGNV